MSDDEGNIPDRDTCQLRTEQFAAITKTNEALAQTFLQDHEWNVDRSISAYYDQLSKEQGMTRKRRADDSELGSLDTSCVEKLFGEGKCVTSEPPPSMKFLSWNLDGLDEVNLKKRMKAVITFIRKHEPDIIFFQEVIPETAEYFEKKLIEYKCIRGNEHGYFTMTLLRVFTIFYDKHYIEEYEGSQMGRNLLVTEAHMGKMRLQLLNTHLESTAEHSAERIKQLKTAFKKATSFSSQFTVILGGDMNLRDKELTGVTQLPLHDLWEYCDSPSQFKYTWDMTKNTNHSNFGKFKPKCRFDRVYLRFGEPKIAVPKHFLLSGFEKAFQTQSFPSDHWAVMVIFSLNH